MENNSEYSAIKGNLIDKFWVDGEVYITLSEGGGHSWLAFMGNQEDLRKRVMDSKIVEIKLPGLRPFKMLAINLNNDNQARPDLVYSIKCCGHWSFYPETGMKEWAEL